MPSGSVGVVSLGLLLTLAACEAPPGSCATVADSAGVRITVSEDAQLLFGELDSLPTLSLGGPEATGPTQFFRIQGIHVDPAGRLWVADAQSGELRIFEPDGTHRQTRGGRGQGPGEFLQIRLLGAPGGDSVLVGDAGVDRVTVFSPDGEFVRTVGVPASDRPAPRLFDVFGDGSVLGQLPRIVPAGSLEPGQILTDSVELVRVDLGSSTTRSYGSAPGPLWLWTGRNQVPVPFTVNASFGVVGEEVHLVSGPDFRIRVHDDRGLQEVYGVRREPRRSRGSDVESYRGFVEEYVPEAMRADYLAALGHDLRPDVLPGYDRVLVSTDGHVWARVYEVDPAAPHDWDVFDVERRFVGRVRTPSGLTPMAVTRDRIVAVWRDTLGVEHVRVYRFARR